MKQLINWINPNIEIALRMCVCTAVSNCKGERFFSVLKRIKDYLRTTIGQQRLSSLAILQIKQEIMNSINFNEIIKKFVEEKCRRKKV